MASEPDDGTSRVHPDDVDLLLAALDRHIRGDAPHLEHEHRMRTRDGEWRWMLSRGLAIRDALGAATRIAGSQTDVTERKVAVERLMHDAFHDALTQLPNRALFIDRLERAMELQRRRPDARYAVLFLDLDPFQAVNDSLGHVGGDGLLLAVARPPHSMLHALATVALL